MAVMLELQTHPERKFILSPHWDRYPGQASEKIFVREASDENLSNL